MIISVNVENTFEKNPKPIHNGWIWKVKQTPFTLAPFTKEKEKKEILKEKSLKINTRSAWWKLQNSNERNKRSI